MMKAFTASLLFLMITGTVVAQSDYKESSNSFAKYSKTGDLKDLENAKKFIDATYKTRRDSSNKKVNVLRAMIYSSMAYSDSTRKIKNDKDPIEIATSALSKIRPRDLDNFQGEVRYIKQNLAAAYIYKANKSIENQKLEEAYADFLQVQKLGSKGEDVTYNLALLATQTNKIDDAIVYYKKLVDSTDADASKYLELADLYHKKGENQLYLNTLQAARTKFLNNKNVLFQLVEVYAQNKSYAAIVPIIDEAIEFEPENIHLIYLAGFANENERNIEAAKGYYTKVIGLDDGNYDANLALGLIHLNTFLQDKNNLEAQYDAQNYLLKANEIKPYAVNTLRGLALFYEAADDITQLDRVNMLLNQLSNN
ncbi:hypothetical protein FAZ19_12335 [Sphingobacterium alkalisoli]|uniref:Uncharacterized protein n=2 Tax=Sphingobacterium alkalisoli TaxID=1874115 RepID=A0A4U0H342_9SPHI|nr:hypothetical protein FAZ19_12335 [Sphingobacterium alkalisoli]GGH17646.1 hypothetical protein GCM10011418_20750 [Sphingobacterium alkalisoli]